MITPERQAQLRGLASPRTAEERQFQSDYVRRCGLDTLFPPKPRKADSFPADYEGAILARAERGQE